MNYSWMRRRVARDLGRCVKLGLPGWAKGFAEELVEGAARRWQASRDSSQPRDLRQRSYERAVRMQDQALDLLGAYMQSQARARDAGIFAARAGNDRKQGHDERSKQGCDTA